LAFMLSIMNESHDTKLRKLKYTLAANLDYNYKLIWISLVSNLIYYI